MALNGGVSLAVWMGGCAVEFDCARRAHLGVETLAAAARSDEESRLALRAHQFFTGEPPPKPPPPVPPPRTVYNLLSRAFGRCFFVALIVAAGLVIGFCAPTVVEGLDDGWGAWTTGCLALLVAPLTAGIYAFVRNPVRMARTTRRKLGGS